MINTPSLFEQVFYASPSGMAVLSLDTLLESPIEDSTIQIWNGTFAATLELPDNLKVIPLSLLPEELFQAVVKAIPHTINSKGIRELECYCKTLDKHLVLTLFLTKDKTLVLTMEDISQKKRIHIEQEQLFLAVQQAAETIVITDAQEHILYVNPAFETITGYSKEEVIGLRPNILNSGKVQNSQYQEMWQTLLKGKRWKGIFINKKKSGALFHEEASISPVFDSQHNISHFVAVKRDITEELKLKEHLEQSRKVEAIGFLAGGIAHEFNNVLAGIIGFAQMSASLAEAGSPLEKYINLILKSADRATKVVEQIENFTTTECSEIVTVDLVDIIRELISFVQKTTPPTVLFHTEFEKTILPIKASANKLHEALLNILSNAIYAIKKKGEIEIYVHSESLTKEIVTPYNIIPSGVYTIIEVSDNGCGIPVQAIKNIFDPFFTTKSLDSGSGMGLAVVSGIMKSHNGFVDVQSSIGLGTVMKLYFPVSQIEEPLRESSQLKESISGSEQILLVEDEELLLYIMQEMLTSLGYTITSFTSSREALSHFKNHHAEYDLLFTDYLMPELNGIELAQKIREIDSEIPIILSTGNRDEIGQEEFHYFTRILKKPQRLEEIAKELQSVFSKKRLQ